MWRFVYFQQLQREYKKLTTQLSLAKTKQDKYCLFTLVNLSWPWINPHLKSAGRSWDAASPSMIHPIHGQLRMNYAEKTAFNSIWHNKNLISNRALQYWCNNNNKKLYNSWCFLWPNLSSKHTDLKKISMQPRHYWALWQKHIKKPEWNKASLISIEKRKQSHSFSSW